MGKNPTEFGSTDTQIRVMESEDCGELSLLHREVDPSPWSEAQFRECLEPPYMGYVLKTEAQLIGFILLVLVDSQAEILSFGIARPEQGRGLGRYLLRKAIDWLPQRIEDIYLEVRVSNRPAIELYRGEGFETVAERREYYQLSSGLREDALVMKRTTNR